MQLKPFKYHIPKTLDEAARLYADLDSVKLQAGGTFLINTLRHLKKIGSIGPKNVISLSAIDELKMISADKNTLTLGAMSTIDDIFNSQHLQDNFSILKSACKNLATQPIRNMGTIGGNLTSRFSWTELPAVMMALDATLHFVDKDKKEYSMSAEDFFEKKAKTDYILSHITIPKNTKQHLSYQRVSKSNGVDIPLLSLCIRTEHKGRNLANCCVAVNNCVSFTQRDKELEQFLNENSKSKKLADKAVHHLNYRIYDERGSDYKKHMFRVSIKQAINEIIK